MVLKSTPSSMHRKDRDGVAGLGLLAIKRDLVGLEIDLVPFEIAGLGGSNPGQAHELDPLGVV